MYYQYYIVQHSHFLNIDTWGMYQKELIGTRLKKTNPNTIKSQCHQFISVSHPHATNKLLHNLHEPEYIKRCTKT